MNFHPSATLLALLTVCLLSASAQEQPVPLNKTDFNKPKHFAELPGKMPLRISDMESLLQQPVGSKVKAALTANFSVVGTVVSKAGPIDPAVRSVVIKSATHPGSTLTITRITEKDGSFSYSGRLLNRAAGDALEIGKEGSAYVMRKKASHEIISE